MILLINKKKLLIQRYQDFKIQSKIKINIIFFKNFKILNFLNQFKLLKELQMIN